MFTFLLYAFFSDCLGLVLNESMSSPPRITVYQHLTGDFGVDLSDPSNTRSSYIVVIESHHGCGDIDNQGDIKGAIAIVKKDMCYYDFARNVALHGGAGLVLGSNIDLETEQMVKFLTKKRNVGIPCVFISEQNYNDIVKVIRKAPVRSVLATLSLEGEYQDKTLWSPSSETIFLAILVLHLMSLIIVVLVRVGCRKEDERVKRRQIHDIAEVAFSSHLVGYGLLNNKLMKNVSCSICLEKFEEQMKIKILPCEHGFHTECIDEWITRDNDSCPVCRRIIWDQLDEVQLENMCCCIKLRQERESDIQTTVLLPEAEPNEINMSEVRPGNQWIEIVPGRLQGQSSC